MVSRVKAYCDFCAEEIDVPSEESVVILAGYRSYATRAEFHRVDVCDNCLKTRNVALELVELERADRAKAEAAAVPEDVTL